MITKTAITYDLREALQQISRGYAADAGRRLGRLVERLDSMLTPGGPRGPKLESSPCAADEFGRKNVHAVRLLCKQASHAIDLHHSEEAQSILHKANDLWEAVPVQGKREVRCEPFL